ncbi:hypothetical protein EDC44_10459 [Cricetibacter osteomyelitidis]|uniref:Lipoprotein n=1 Tax=Cricetibacter osteomyelitidis TaxID=1521931 RepID=A0A4R2T578_9PAST|nr:hypothetical protein [Cricetibacter osteomyelitidis]TCP96526.1 hypothetical protein EDC44_10459 [Cricetibacter osteomyelitidis]
MKYLLIILFLSLSACLPFEPIMGTSVIYNFCEYPIEVRNEKFPDKEYEENKNYRRKIINSNDAIYGTFIVQDNLLDEQIKNAKMKYFLKNGSKMKTRFYFEIYSKDKQNLVACPENAKPTGDGNWIRAK